MSLVCLELCAPPCPSSRPLIASPPLRSRPCTVVGIDLFPSQPKGFEEGEPFTHDLVKQKFGVRSVFVQGDVTQEATWELVKEAALSLTSRIDMSVRCPSFSFPLANPRR